MKKHLASLSGQVKEGITSYFNNMIVWRVNVLGAEAAGGAASPEYAKPVDITSSSEDDDLPF